MGKQVTIHMPQESLDKWLEALRSGKYAQGKRTLKTREGSYCCLGVLEHCLTGKVEMDGATPHSLPSRRWLEEHNIHFSAGAGVYPSTDYTRLAPWLPTLNQAAYSANDGGKYDFKQIADAIEACAVGV